MQQHTSDNQTVDAQGTSGVTAPQMQRQQLQVISPARTTVDPSGATRQGILYQEAMQNFQGPQAFPPLGSATNAMNAQQQISDWNGDGRFVQQPLRYSSTTLQPVYDFRGQLLTPGNFSIHPANVNQLVQMPYHPQRDGTMYVVRQGPGSQDRKISAADTLMDKLAHRLEECARALQQIKLDTKTTAREYAYDPPQQRPSQGPVAQFTPWQTIFTPNQGLTWVPGGIQATTIDGQGNHVLNRNLQHDSQPGVFIQNGQPQLQQLKQMDCQHAPIPKTVINENFTPTLPTLVTTVNNMRAQQQVQNQPLQTMHHSQKVVTKNSIRLANASTSHKNSGYHTTTTASIAHPPPPVSSNAQESKRMKQTQVSTISLRKDLMPVQQTQKRHQHIQGNHGLVSLPVSNSVPCAPEGVKLPVMQATPLLQNVIPESVTSASSTIQILPGTPMSQGTLINSSPVATVSLQQQEIQGDSEHRKRIQLPGGPVLEQNRVEPHGSIRELGKCIEEKSDSKQRTLPDVEEIYCEDADACGRSEKDNSGATTAKATVLVKPQTMTHATEGSLESVSSAGDWEDGQAKSEADGKIMEDDDKELNRKAIAESDKEDFPCSNKQQTKQNLSKWTVADVYEFIRTMPGCSEYAEDFVAHDIDGEALMLLKTDHLVTAMSMTLGPAMKIISRIDAMREDAGSPAK